MSANYALLYILLAHRSESRDQAGGLFPAHGPNQLIRAYGLLLHNNSSAY